MHRVCCVCQRVEEDGVWVEKVLLDNRRPTHGYCSVCAALAREELALFCMENSALGLDIETGAA